MCATKSNKLLLPLDHIERQVQLIGSSAHIQLLQICAYGTSMLLNSVVVPWHDHYVQIHVKPPIYTSLHSSQCSLDLTHQRLQNVMK